MELPKAPLSGSGDCVVDWKKSMSHDDVGK